jgi:MFS family permease
VLFARVVDRVGKGIRGAPRDALVADLTPEAARGASYGLRQALDTAGAVVGPLLAIGLMSLSGGDFRLVFGCAVAPAAASLALVVFGVEDRAAGDAAREESPPMRAADLGLLGAGYWSILAVGAVLHLARFSGAFLLLRAQSAGLAATWVPLAWVAMNAAYALSSYPAGALSDRVGRGPLLAAGMALLAASDLVLALVTQVGAVLAGIVLWGLHLGLTQGLLAARIADAAPPRVRGTAFGLFHLATGAAMLAASPAAGWLWQRFGAKATFLAGAALVLVALAGLALVRGAPQAHD